MTVCDISNYDMDTFDPVCFKLAGVTGVIIGCQQIAIARKQAKGLIEQAIPIIGLYGFDYFGTIGDADSPGADIGDACDLADELRNLMGWAGIIWVDAEIDGGPPVSPEQRVQEIAECIALIEGRGYRAGIYTGSWWWIPNTGNSQAFAHLPLWHAAYGSNALPIGPITTVDYGGWTNVAIHQFTSRLEICGRGRDANYVFMENDMTPAQEAILNLNNIRLTAFEYYAVGVTGQEAIDYFKTYNAENGTPMTERLSNIEAPTGPVGQLGKRVEALEAAPAAPAPGFPERVELRFPGVIEARIASH